MEKMMGQKCYVTLKMHKQLFTEHLRLQKAFCALYQHLFNRNGAKNSTNWQQEKNNLEAIIKILKSKILQLQRKLDMSTERCELLEFCLLELENQSTVCKKDKELVDQSVNTDTEEWKQQILNSCHDCKHAVWQVMNSDALKDETVKAKMNSENYKLQLEETQKKMESLTKDLDNVLKYNCKLGVGMDYVIATVNELQSLMEWTSEKRGAKTDNAIILQKLQQLERIQKNLEKTSTESEEIRSRTEQERSSCMNPSDINGTSKIDQTIFQDDQMLLLDDCLKKIELLSSKKNHCSRETPSPLLIDLSTPESEDIKDFSLEDISSKAQNRDHLHDSLGPNISEDEGLGDESRRADSIGPSSFIELHDKLSVTQKLSSGIHYPGNKQIVIDPGGRTIKESLEFSTDPTNTLNFCLYTIENLRDSLKTKENELLKLSVIQSDQHQMTALQEVVITLHKEAAHLRSELDKSQKENVLLKEQVLELEEAENDARLQAQQLGEKLIFLQEKDTHFQAKLCETKKALEKCIAELNIKKSREEESKKHIQYLEDIAKKYEEQLKSSEIVELSLRKKLLEEEEERKAIEQTVNTHQVPKQDRGTQMYDPLPHRCSSSPKECTKTLKDDTIQTQKYPSKNACIQVSDIQKIYVDSSIQTEHFINSGETMNIQTASVSIIPDVFKGNRQPELLSIDCPVQKELLKRLHQLVEDDAYLQQQLHYVDQINLTLWKKLHNLEFYIGECKRKNVSDDVTSDSCIDSDCDFSSRPLSREHMRDDSVFSSQYQSPVPNRGIIASFDQNEHKIKEKLWKLEKINSSFEKELELREKLYSEKEKKYGEWVKTEQRCVADMKRLSDERDSLANQVEQLQKERDDLSFRVTELQTTLDDAKEKYQLESQRIRAEKDDAIAQLQKRVEQLLLKEKEHLKQITNLKLENNNKTESEKLKLSYVELQLELSRTKEEMRMKEEEFRIQLDEFKSNHIKVEAKLQADIEMLQGKNAKCDQMIENFHSRQNELFNILREKEQVLEKARIDYKKNMETTEDQHRAFEAELKRQLREMEEGTCFATRALTEEKIRVEKELQGNIDDLKSKEEVYKARIQELESNVSHLHNELHRLTGDLDSGEDMSSFRREKLLGQLRDLRDRESELREKLDEMEQKEAAYRETLEHADRIVYSVEQGYKHKIDELEISERLLKQRVGHLEEEESRLRGALHKERRSSDGRKPDDLVMELLEAEAREMGLKERLQLIEQLQRNSANQIKDLEKLRDKLENQLGDKEELSLAFEKTQQELELTRKSLTKLTKSESDLKSSLLQMENAFTVTQTHMTNRIRVLDEEKKGLEDTVDELRIQVRDLKKTLESVVYEKEELSTAHNTAHSCNNLDADEPDYVDIDEYPTQTEKKQCKDQNNLNRLSVLPVENSKNSFNKISSLIPNTLINQPIITNLPDKYDSARQNLEDCMLRAMAAMKNDMQKKAPRQHAAEENDYDEVLPRPTNFRVVQQVCSDTLLVGWNYVNPSLLEGFEVYLDGQLHETVYAPDRTKALISGLDLKKPLRLGICALSRHGQMSNPTILELPLLRQNNSFHLQDEDNDEDDDSSFEDSYEKKRPYSMEW